MTVRAGTGGVKRLLAQSRRSPVVEGHLQHTRRSSGHRGAFGGRQIASAALPALDRARQWLAGGSSLARHARVVRRPTIRRPVVPAGSFAPISTRQADRVTRLRAVAGSLAPADRLRLRLFLLTVLIVVPVTARPLDTTAGGLAVIALLVVDVVVLVTRRVPRAAAIRQESALYVVSALAAAALAAVDRSGAPTLFGFAVTGAPDIGFRTVRRSASRS